jgi:hypothetical protein
MRRVHSDSGDSLEAAANAQVSNVATASSTKGRKRKSKETSTGPSGSRKSLTKPKASHETSRAKEDAIVHIHVDEWQEHQRALLQITSTLQQDGVATELAIQDAQKHLEHLAKLSRRNGSSRRHQDASASKVERLAGKRRAG